MPVVRVVDNTRLFTYIGDLKKRYPKLKVVGTTAHKEKPVYNEDLSQPVIIMIGNEAMGLNKLFKEYYDQLCTIPMNEESYASSLNVGCAASILMYEVNRQRSIEQENIK